MLDYRFVTHVSASSRRRAALLQLLFQASHVICFADLRQVGDLVKVSVDTQLLPGVGQRAAALPLLAALPPLPRQRHPAAQHEGGTEEEGPLLGLELCIMQTLGMAN